MNTRPTPETDALRDLYENHEHRANVGDIWDLCESLERERDELKRWTSVNGVIDLQRERDEAREQRDRLAEALQRIRDGYGGQVASPNCCEDCDYLLPIDEALQSLTPKL